MTTTIQLLAILVSAKRSVFSTSRPVLCEGPDRSDIQDLPLTVSRTFRHIWRCFLSPNLKYSKIRNDLRSAIANVVSPTSRTGRSPHCPSCGFASFNSSSGYILLDRGIRNDRPPTRLLPVMSTAPVTPPSIDSWRSDHENVIHLNHPQQSSVFRSRRQTQRPSLDISLSTDYSDQFSSTPCSAPSPLTLQDSHPFDADDAWNLIPYHVSWGHEYEEYRAGTLPGPEGNCIFLRSPTPLKNQRATEACKKCRERKAKVRFFSCSASSHFYEHALIDLRLRGNVFSALEPVRRVRVAAHADLPASMPPRSNLKVPRSRIAVVVVILSSLPRPLSLE